MRILYLEDNPSDVDQVRRALLRAEPQTPGSLHALVVAPTLADARQALLQPENFDLVLVDMALPDGSGLDLVADMRLRQLPLAVVVLTGQGDEELVLAAIKAGADDYLSKSSQFSDQLLPTLHAAMAVFHADNARHAQPLRLLYVEHNGIDIDLTRRHLAAHAGHVLLTWAPDAETALLQLPKGPDEPARFDVLLLDFRLARDSGLSLLRILRKDRGLDLPVVLVTGQGNEEVAALTMRLGATDYLVKRSNYLMALPSVLENAFHRVQAAREQAALRSLNATLEHKVAERTAALEAAMLAAETANQSKSAFLARMSHDLRTPLNAVLGFSQLLALSPELANSPRALQQVALINDAGTHLLAMIDEVLDLARIESGGLNLHPVALDACHLVHDCLQLVGPMASQHQVTLHHEKAPPGACRVRADQTRLRQVLINLLSNAIKYNRQGGLVEVTLSMLGKQIAVAVRDTGRGMTTQQQASLFQPYNRVGAEASGIEGSGLGLVIAKQLVEAMGGQLLLSSQAGEGSMFTVLLPAAGAAAPA